MPALNALPSPDTLDDPLRQQWQSVYDDVYAETADALKAQLAAWGAVHKDRVMRYYGMKSANGNAVVVGWALLFTAADDPDLDQQYFDQTTVLGLDYYENAPLWMEHGQDPRYGSAPIGRRVVTNVYSRGVWLEHELDAAHPLYDETLKRVERGELSYSTDTIGHYMRNGFDPNDGRLGIWFAAGCSLTDHPAEPALGAVTLTEFTHAVKAAAEAREAQRPGGDARPSSFTKDTEKDKRPMNKILEGLAEFFGVEPEADAVKSQLTDLIGKMEAELAGAAPAEDAPAPDAAAMPDMAQLRAALGLSADAGNGEIASRLQELLGMLSEQPEMKSFNYNGLQAAYAQAAKSAAVTTPAVPAHTRAQEGVAGKGVNYNRGVKVPGLAKLVQGIVDGKSQSAMKAMGYSVGASGSYFLRQEVAAEMIELFRANTVVDKLGATYVPMSGIESLTYRKQLTGATATYRGEAQAGNQSDLTFGIVNLQLRELFAGSRVNRRLLRNSEENLENMLRRDLQIALSLRADLAALTGTGGTPNETGATGAEPRGIRNTTGVTSTNLANNGAVPTVKNFVDAWGRLEDANVPTSGSWGAAMSPRTRRTLENLTDTTGQLLDIARWTQGHKVETTTQIINTRTVGSSTDTSEVYLGDWQYLIYGLGQDVEIVVDESIYRLYGEVYIEATLMHDVGVAQPTAFQILAGVRA